MTKINEEIRCYEREAEEKYDDFDDDDFDTGLEGREDHFEEENFDEDSFEEIEYIGGEEEHYDENYDHYAQTSIGKIDPNDRTLTITVTNTGLVDVEVVIFGANEGIVPPPGVTIVVQESSHNEVREESKANPFKIQGMKMSVSDPLQFDNIWAIVKRTSAGSETRRKYQPRNASSPQNNNPNLIDDITFEMDVTGQDSIRFVQKFGHKSTLTLTIKARVDMGNVLMGQNVAEMATAPRPTGLPQIDMVQQKNTPVFGMRPQPRKVIRRIVRRPVNNPQGPRPRRRLIKKRR